MKNYKHLLIWQRGIKIVTATYIVSKLLPDSERYNLTSQMNRAAVSIPSNIAEGGSRSSEKDYKRFLEYSLGSCFELETQCLIIKELNLGNHIAVNDLLKLLEEEVMMIYGFMRKLN